MIYINCSKHINGENLSHPHKFCRSMKWWECEVQLPVPWADPGEGWSGGRCICFFFSDTQIGICYSMMVNPYLWEFLLPFELGNLVKVVLFLRFFKRMYWQPLNGHWWNGKSIILEGSTCDSQGVRRVVTCHTYSRYIYCWSCWMILKVWVEIW